MNHLRPIAVLTILAAALAVGGCAAEPNQGYTTDSMYRSDIMTVAVPIWTRGATVYRRGLEFRLTEALVKRIEQTTPYRVANKADADTILEGQILSISQTVLSTNPDTGTPRDLQMQIVISFTWTDLRTGQTLAQRKRLVGAGTYSQTQKLDEDFFLGSSSAIDQLAHRVVESLEQPW